MAIPMVTIQVDDQDIDIGHDGGRNELVITIINANEDEHTEQPKELHMNLMELGSLLGALNAGLNYLCLLNRYK